MVSTEFPTYPAGELLMKVTFGRPTPGTKDYVAFYADGSATTNKFLEGLTAEFVPCGIVRSTEGCRTAGNGTVLFHVILTPGLYNIHYGSYCGPLLCSDTIHTTSTVTILASNWTPPPQPPLPTSTFLSHDPALTLSSSRFLGS